MINSLYSLVSQPSGVLTNAVQIGSVGGRDAGESTTLDLTVPSGATTLVEHQNYRIPIDLSTPLDCRDTRPLDSKVEILSRRVATGHPGVRDSIHTRYAPGQSLGSNTVTSQGLAFNPITLQQYRLTRVLNRTGKVRALNAPVLTQTPTPATLSLTTNDLQVYHLGLLSPQVYPAAPRDEVSTYIDTSTPVALNMLYGVGTQTDYNWSNLNTSPLLSEAYVPGPSTGYLAASGIGPSMTSKTPESIAYGLFWACSERNDDLVISGVRALLHTAETWGFIEELDGVWRPVVQLVGFPQSFDPNQPLQTDISWVKSNAFLGLGLCNAIRYLQDRFPIASVKLYGQDASFGERTRALILYLARYCAESVSLSSWWSCRTVQQEQPDRIDTVASSCCVALFLSAALSIQYDPFVHARAARVQYSLVEAPLDLGSDFYQDFGDLTDQEGLDPDETLSASALLLVGLRDMAAYRALWLLQNGSSEAIGSALARIDFLRAALIQQTGNTDRQDCDYIAAYCAAYATQVYEVIFNPVPNWIQTLWVENNPLVLRSSALFSLVNQRYRVFSLEPFDFLEEQAFSLMAQDLSELRRMWPNGPAWTSEEAQNDQTQTLGSILSAQAQMGFDWNLHYALARQTSDPYRVQGSALLAQTQNLLPNTLLCSDAFRRDYLVAYQGVRPEDFRELLNQAGRAHNLKALDSFIDPPAPYSTYRTDPFATVGDWSSYTGPRHEFSGESITSEQYLTIAYRPTVLNASDVTDISQPLACSASLGLGPRKVKGFPYRYLRADMVDPATDISQPILLNTTPSLNPQQEGYYPDGPVLIKPFQDHYPIIRIVVPEELGDLFIPFFLARATAGFRYYFQEGLRSNDIELPPYTQDFSLPNSTLYIMF